MSRASRLKAKKRRQYKRMIAKRAVKRLLGNPEVEWTWKSVTLQTASLTAGRDMLNQLKNICEAEGWTTNERVVSEIQTKKV